MNRLSAIVLTAGVLLLGCRSDSDAAAEDRAVANDAVAAGSTLAPAPAGTAAGDDVVARIGNRAITMNQLRKPLVEAYGLNMLLNLVQLELARDTAQRQGIAVTPQDIAQERDMTLARMYADAPKEDYPALTEQFLAQQRITEAEFQLVIETNAYLRKIAEPRLQGKITEENIKEAFLQTYGETVKVRHIQCANLQEIAEAQRRLAEGQPFEQVARDMSRNAHTKGVGGVLPAFSANTPGLPQAFKDAAFTMQPGEVSDPVQAQGAYHLIKLEERNAPKAVKYEDHREIVRADLYDRLLQAAVKELRQQLAQQALQQLHIEEPTLRAQFDARKQRREAEIKEREEFRRDQERQRQRLATQPMGDSGPAGSDDPLTDPVFPPSPSPDAPADDPLAPSAPESEAEPATRPAPATPPASGQ